MSRSKKPKGPTPAQRAKKRAERYLTPLVDAAGEIQGYRFAPGPHLRAKGAKSKVLTDAHGRFLTLDEAKLFRDSAVAAAEGGVTHEAPALAPLQQRTLDALWKLYRDTKRAQIAKNATLPPDRRDDDAIKPATLRFYTSMIKPWLEFAGDTPAAALDGDTIKAEYKNQKTERGHHAAHASYRSLLALLAFGVSDAKWLEANPARELGLTPPRGRLRLGSPEEIEALVDAADALAQRAIDDALAASVWLAAHAPRYANRISALLFSAWAVAENWRSIGDAIVAALWTAQRQQDLLACDLGLQLRDGVLIFARTHEADYSQQKVQGRVEQGGQAQVDVLPPLAERLRGRTIGPLVARWDGQRWGADAFRHAYADVRAEAAKRVASVASLQYRDLRDTSITRLDEAEVKITSIAIWSGHSLKTIHEILQAHYLVTSRKRAQRVAEKMDAWRKAEGVKW